LFKVEVHGRGNAGEVDLAIPALSAADAARLRPLHEAVGARSPAHLAAEWWVRVPTDASAEVVAAAAALVQVSECLVLLECKGLGAADAGVLCAVLERVDGGRPTVSELAIMGSVRGHLGDEGAAPVANVLKVNATLTELNLSENKISDAGAVGLGKAAVGLGKALEANATLTRLDLRWNRRDGNMEKEEVSICNSLWLLRDAKVARMFVLSLVLHAGLFTLRFPPTFPFP
jgi:hypothetical protein